MAGLPVQFSNPMDLEKLYGMNPYSAGMMEDQMKYQNGLANQFALQGLEEGRHDIRTKELANIFSEQANPLKVEELRLGNTGKGYENRMNAVKADISEKTAPQQLDAAMKELVTKASDADLKKMENEGQRMAYSNDPREREMGMYILQSHRDFVKMREQEKLKTSGDIAVETLRGKNARSLEQMRIDAGKYNRAGTAKTVEQRLLAARTFQEKAGILEEAAAIANAAGDSQAADVYLTRSNQMKTADLERQTAAGQARQAGQVDAAATTGLPAIQVPAPTQFGNQPKPAAPPATGASAGTPGTLADVQKLYPGVPAEKLREAYKKKFGVDLK